MSGTHHSISAPKRSPHVETEPFCITVYIELSLKAYSWLPIDVDLAWKSLQGFTSYFIIIRFYRQNHLPLKLPCEERYPDFPTVEHLTLSRPGVPTWQGRPKGLILSSRHTRTQGKLTHRWSSRGSEGDPHLSSNELTYLWGLCVFWESRLSWGRLRTPFNENLIYLKKSVCAPSTIFLCTIPWTGWWNRQFQAKALF